MSIQTIFVMETVRERMLPFYVLHDCNTKWQRREVNVNTKKSSYGQKEH
jgi:hypothetical protein